MGKITNEQVAICDENRTMSVGTEIYCPFTDSYVIKESKYQYCASGECTRKHKKRYLRYHQRFLTPGFSVESHYWPATQSGLNLETRL